MRRRTSVNSDASVHSSPITRCNSSCSISMIPLVTNRRQYLSLHSSYVRSATGGVLTRGLHPGLRGFKHATYDRVLPRKALDPLKRIGVMLEYHHPDQVEHLGPD